jgi:hypothetical protein
VRPAEAERVGALPTWWLPGGMDEALCEAIWRLRLTQSEKSARDVHDELVREDRWSHLSLSDVKKTSSKMAKAGWQPPAEAVSPQADEPSQSDAPATVNPKKLVKWRGLGSPPMQKVGEQGLGPLTFAFSEAVPFGVKVALGTGRPTADIMPRSLWANALASVANACEDKACYRVAVSEPTQREGLLIDILSEALTCPPDVPTNETEWKEQPSGAPAGTAETEPLLMIRYLRTSRDDHDAEASLELMAQTSPPGMTYTRRDDSKKFRSPSKPCPVMLSALRARGVHDPANFELRSVEVESAEVLDAAVEMLAANEEALAPGYRKEFAAQSPSHQGKPAFRPSFLVPPPAPRLPSSKAACGNCGKLEADQKFQRCDGCKSAVYCSSACQTAHWPVHKKVRAPSLLPSLPCMSLQTSLASGVPQRC